MYQILYTIFCNIYYIHELQIHRSGVEGMHECQEIQEIRMLMNTLKTQRSLARMQYTKVQKIRPASWQQAFPPQYLLAHTTQRAMASKAAINHLRSPVRCSTINAPVLSCFAPSWSCRYASGLSRNDSRARDQPKKKKKQRSEFKNQSLRDALQFSLCDAMR